MPKRPNPVHGFSLKRWLSCALGYHSWHVGDGHWRRWCVDCGHGHEAPPERPKGKSL